MLIMHYNGCFKDIDSCPIPAFLLCTLGPNAAYFGTARSWHTATRYDVVGLIKLVEQMQMCQYLHHKNSKSFLRE